MVEIERVRYFRLYTERFNNVSSLTAKYFDGFTLIDSIGYWKGNKEKSVIVELIIEEKEMVKLYSLISDIKLVNSQESVLLIEIKNCYIDFA